MSAWEKGGVVGVVLVSVVLALYGIAFAAVLYGHLLVWAWDVTG